MAQQDYYELLGVPREATPDQVKQRFRKLAREHHPDLVGQDKDHHEFFVRISEAYHVLSDPGRRAAYDLALRDQDRLRAQFAARRPSPRPAGPRTPGGWPDATAPQSPRSPAAQARAREEQRRRTQLDQMVQAAEAQFSLGRLKDAVQLCRQVLAMDRNNAAAYELLGDIHGRQREFDEAIRHYTLAAQLTPHNGLLMAKLNRLLAREGGSAAYNTVLGRRRVNPARAKMLATQQVLVCLVGMSVLLFLIGFYAQGPDRVTNATQLGWPLVEHWTEKLLLWLVISGWIAGATMALGNIIGPLEEELLYSARGRGRRGVPIGVLLAVTGGLFFYLGAIVYGLFASAQQSASRSVVIVLFATITLMGAFAGISWMHNQNDIAQAREILLFGGNVVFLSMLAGWFIGDIFRPVWA